MIVVDNQNLKLEVWDSIKRESTQSYTDDINQLVMNPLMVNYIFIILYDVVLIIFGFVAWKPG